MIDVLYSLVDVNQRFDRLALDSLYIHDLNMTDTMTINSFYEKPCSIDTQVISKICETILPHIHRQVHELTIEECSMKSILTANYPQLYSLSLINFQEQILYQYLTDDVILRDLLTKQITHLNIDIKKTSGPSTKIVSKIFALILSLCKNLTVLNFCHMFTTRRCSLPICYLPPTNCISSTLIKLKITVSCFLDCLYLVDGGLDSLSTLIINVSNIFCPELQKDSKKKLLKLKYFSLSSPKFTNDYDNAIVPFLCRMRNLEELKLYLLVERFNSTYIDGVQLYDQFLVYMTQLKKFTFNIKTDVSNIFLRVKLPSNEDIQHSFIGRGYQQVTSYVHNDSMKNNGKCLIYSFPYEFDYFYNLDNSFQSGIFHKVRYLTMYDTIALEHKLFKLISEDFPFLEFLRICNHYSPKNKEYSLTLIVFPYLTYLDLQDAHDDYVELFLLKRNAHLPHLLNLSIQYKSLITITNNFTNDAMYFNFSKLKSLDVCQTFVRPKNFHEYFPLL